MPLRTRIAPVARERGMSAAELARRLGLYRSNISLMDAGKRTVSLRLLSRIAELVGCSPLDLIQWVPENQKAVFRSKTAWQKLLRRDFEAEAESEKTWVHTVTRAWRKHYGAARRKK